VRTIQSAVVVTRKRESLRTQLKELRDANTNSRGNDNTPEAEVTDLEHWKQAFMAIRLKPTGAGYRTLD